MVSIVFIYIVIIIIIGNIIIIILSLFLFLICIIKLFVGFRSGAYKDSEYRHIPLLRQPGTLPLRSERQKGP